MHQMSIKLLNRLVSHEDEDEDDNVAVMLSAHVGVEFSLPEAIFFSAVCFCSTTNHEKIKI